MEKFIKCAAKHPRHVNERKGLAFALLTLWKLFIEGSGEICMWCEKASRKGCIKCGSKFLSDVFLNQSFCVNLALFHYETLSRHILNLAPWERCWHAGSSSGEVNLTGAKQDQAEPSSFSLLNQAFDFHPRISCPWSEGRKYSLQNCKQVFRMYFHIANEWCGSWQSFGKLGGKWKRDALPRQRAFGGRASFR